MAQKVTCIESREKNDGASLVEYVLLVALIAAVCIGALTLFGQKTSAQFSNIAGQIAN